MVSFIIIKCNGLPLVITDARSLCSNSSVVILDCFCFREILDASIVSKTENHIYHSKWIARDGVE